MLTAQPLKSGCLEIGVVHFYSLFARTGEGSRGISCFLAPGAVEGVAIQHPWT